MANEDSFIDEVNEEVRRDRLFTLFRRYGWIAILAILLLVGGAGWNEWRKASERAEAQARGNALLDALGAEAGDDQQSALADIAPGNNPDTQALIALMAAGVALQNGSDDVAAEALANATGSSETSAIYRDLATLKSVIASGQDLTAQERIDRLQGLALPGAPFALVAREQIALAEISRGNAEAAIEELSQIAQDQAASQALRQRAIQLIVALGGDLAN